MYQELLVLHPQITPSPGVKIKQKSPCLICHGVRAHDIPVLIGLFPSIQAPESWDSHQKTQWRSGKPKSKTENAMISLTCLGLAPAITKWQPCARCNAQPQLMKSRCITLRRLARFSGLSNPCLNLAIQKELRGLVGVIDWMPCFRLALFFPFSPWGPTLPI